MARRPFSFILEEAVDGRDLEEAKALTESELEAIKTEATAQDIEISQDVAAIEELMAEQEVVCNQIQSNNEKLSNPDIVVTAVDVEVSEECYKNVCYRLGFKTIDTLKFSNESTFNAVKAEPRKYLATSNEGLGDVLQKIWEKIKAFFRKIGEMLGLRKKADDIKIEQAKEKAAALKEELEKNPLSSKVGGNNKSQEQIDRKVDRIYRSYPMLGEFFLALGEEGIKWILDDGILDTVKNYIQIGDKLLSGRMKYEDGVKEIKSKLTIPKGNKGEAFAKALDDHIPEFKDRPEGDYSIIGISNRKVDLLFTTGENNSRIIQFTTPPGVQCGDKTKLFNLIYSTALRISSRLAIKGLSHSIIYQDVIRFQKYANSVKIDPSKGNIESYNYLKLVSPNYCKGLYDASVQVCAAMVEIVDIIYGLRQS